MEIKRKPLPKLGARTIKTGITVLICSIISLIILKRDTAFVSSMAGVICLQNTVKGSVITGKNRILGTIVGAILGFIVLFLSNNLNNNPMVVSIAGCLGIIATIYICILFEIKECINTSCMMFLILLMSVGTDNSFNYTIIRTIDTFIGVLVGVTVNKYMFKKSFKHVKKNK